MVPSPLILADSGSLRATGATAVTAGAAYFTWVNLLVSVTVTQMRVNFSGVPTGNVDMGIYDATGTNGQPNTLLGHTGAIAAATGLFTQNLLSNLLLPAGRYWLAFVDTVADSPFNSACYAGGPVVYRTSSTALASLPGTAGALIATSLLMAISGLVQGGFS